MIEKQVLLYQTAKYLFGKDLNTFSLHGSVPLEDVSSHWMCIVYECLKKYDLEEAKTLCHKWTNNIDSFRENVNLLLQIKDFFPTEYIHKQVTVELSFLEWIYLQSHLTTNGVGRQSFLVAMDNLLTEKLQVLGIKCCLRSNYNWIAKKTTMNYWSGKYHCKKRECLNYFEALITTEPLQNSCVCIDVTCYEFSNHERVKISFRCVGEERQAVANNISAKGVQRVRNENVILNALCNHEGMCLKIIIFLQFQEI